MAKKEQLTSEFILELFKAAFEKDYIFEILVQYLKYSYLTYDYEKKFWKKALQIYKLKNKIPTLGLIQVELRKDEAVKDFIIDIKEARLRDVKSVVDSFQEFIKESKFVEIFEKAGELYNRGDESEAFKEFQKGAEEMSLFSIQDKVFKKVFKGFEERHAGRKIDEQRTKLPFFIDRLDEITYGGSETGEITLVTAESGIGKSQYLIHRAIQTARSGYDVLLFQIEGTERQVMDRLDAAWTGALYHDMKKGNIDDKRYKKLLPIIKKMSGEIHVEAFEKFGGATDTDIKNSVLEAKKMYPNLKLVLIDYMELMTLNDGTNYGPRDERFRQQKIGRFMKELAMEQDVGVDTVTQASNLPSDLKADPSFVMTREYLSEDKGKIRPFDYHFTLNQTFDEMKFIDTDGVRASIIRMYADKIREYSSGQTVPIITNFKSSRFYDRRRTLEHFIDDEDE